MPTATRPVCSDISAEAGESLAGTASRVANWVLIEYRGVWNPKPVAGSGLSDQIKAHLRAQVRALWPAKLLFVRRRERRRGDRIAVFHAASGVAGARRFDLDRYEELLDIDFMRPSQPAEKPVDHPLFLVCTHGKHDRCCALHGRPLYDVLVDQAEPGWVWQASHVGGDRFAGNVVVLPEALYYGRVRPEEAWALLDEHLAGRLYLPRFRGRSPWPFAVQAAEIAVRQRYSLSAVGVEQIESRRLPDRRWQARFAIEGRSFEVELRVEPGPLTYLTCGAEVLRRPPRYVVESLRESAA